MMSQAFVYMWIDKGTEKRYIGVHKGTPEDGYVCSSTPMLREYNKRPHEFERNILCCGTWKDMLSREQELIAEYGAVKSPMFYNQSNKFGPFHADRTGSKMSEEQKARLSESMKGNTLMVGRKLSKEWRARMSASRTGQKFTEERKKNISAGQMGKKRGKIHSEEFKLKMSLFMRGKPKSEEHKARISAALIGNKNGSGKNKLTNPSNSAII